MIARETNVLNRELALQVREQRFARSQRQLDSDQKLLEEQKRILSNRELEFMQQMKVFKQNHDFVASNMQR